MCNFLVAQIFVGLFFLRGISGIFCEGWSNPNAKGADFGASGTVF
jgi:hypothetical protein